MVSARLRHVALRILSSGSILLSVRRMCAGGGRTDPCHGIRFYRFGRRGFS